MTGEVIVLIMFVCLVVVLYIIASCLHDLDDRLEALEEHNKKGGK